MDGRTPSPPGAGRKYWEWCGKVQERGRRAAVLLYAMPRRTRLLLYVIVAAVAAPRPGHAQAPLTPLDSAILADRKSTRLNSSHGYISYAVFCLKKKKRK